MALVTKEFKLDLAPGQLRPVVNASQGDIGRPFKADLYWNGSPWTATGYTAKLRGKKPDNTVFEYTATVSGSSVTFSTTEQMTIIPGFVECELVFSNDGDIIASANFLLIVEDSPYNPDALSESVVPGINDLVDERVDDLLYNEGLTEVGNVRDRLTNLDGLYYPVFEQGDMYISNGVPVWGGSSGDKRIRTPQDKPISVKAGDNITINSAYRFIAYYYVNETYNSSNGGWATAATVPLDCDMYCLVRCEPSTNTATPESETGFAIYHETIIDEKLLTYSNVKGGDFWAVGSWDTSGNIGGDARRIRSVIFPEQMTFINSYAPYEFTVSAWESGTFKGYLHVNGTISTSTSDIAYVHSFDVEQYRAAFPTYSFRALVRNSTAVNSNIDATDAMSNIFVTFKGATNDYTTDLLSDNAERVGVPLVQFEYGHMDNYGKAATYNADRRVRTTFPVHLKVGDVFGLTDYNGTKYAYMRSATSTFTGWFTSNTTVETEDDYKIVIAHDAAAISSVYDLANLFFINRKGSYLGKMYDALNAAELLENPIHSYYYTDDYLTDKIEEVKDATNILNGVTFAFVTDMHFNDNSKQSKYLLKEVLKNTTVPFVLCGGDFPTAYGTMANLETEYNEAVTYAKTMDNGKWFAMVGNHDMNKTASAGSSTHYYLNWAQTYNGILRPSEMWKVNNDVSGGYYCIDNDAQKTRIVVMNTSEPNTRAYNSNLDGSNRVRTEQLQWLIDVLKEKAGYHVIVALHITGDSLMPYYGVNSANIQAIIEAFENKTTYSVSGLTGTFASVTSTLVCVLCGHGHRDISHRSNGVLSIMTTCDAHYNDDGWNLISGHGSASAGTINEQAFDIFSFNYDTGDITAVRIGRGENREWNINDTDTGRGDGTGRTLAQMWNGSNVPAE